MVRARHLIITACMALAATRPACAQSDREPAVLEIKNWPVGVARKQDLPTARSYQYSFQDVQTSNLVQWLSRVRITIPVKISGALSGWLYVQRSEKGWLNFKDYRIEGEIVSPKLDVDVWEFEDAKLRFGFHNNTWYVSKISGVVGAASSPEAIGIANFAGIMTMSGTRLLQISGNVHSAKIRPLLKAFDFDFEIANDVGKFTIAANVPFADIRNVSAWKSKAAIEFRGIRAPDIPPSNLSADLSISDSQWNIGKGRLTIRDQLIDFDGSGLLEPNLPYTASISGSKLELSSLLETVHEVELSTHVSGSVDIVGQVRGNLDRYVEAASAAIRSRSIAIDGESIENVLVEGILDNRRPNEERVELILKSVTIGGGLVRGKATWNSLPSIRHWIPDQAQFVVDDIDLNKLPPRWTSVPIQGIAAGRLKIDSQYDSNANVHQWSTDVQLTAERFAIMGTDLGNANIEISKSLDSDQLQAQLESSQGAIHGRIEIAIDAGENVVGTRFGVIKDYEAHLVAHQLRTSVVLNESVPPISLELSGSGSMRGSPTHWLESGHAELTELNATLQERPIQLSNVVVEISEDEFRLERFTIRDDSPGRIAGSALIRLNDQGEHLLNLRLVNLEIQSYADMGPRVMHGLTGTINLEARLKKNAEDTSYITGWRGSAHGEIADVEYRSVPVGGVKLDAEIIEDRIEGSLIGQVLGGDLVLQGSTRADQFFMRRDKDQPADQTNPTFTASMLGLNLQRVMILIAGPDQGIHYNGAANVFINSKDERDDYDFRFSIPNFRYKRQELARDLSIRASYRDQRYLVVDDMAGSLAGGRVDIRGGLSLENGIPTGELRFAADGMNAQSLAAIFYPSYARHYAGGMSYRGQIQLGPSTWVRGHAHFTDAVIFEVPVQDVHSDLSFKLSSTGQFVEMIAHSARGTAIGGRFDGQGQLRGGSKYSFEAEGTVDNGKLDQLSRALGFEQIVGTGSFHASTKLVSKDFFQLGALYGPMQLVFNSGDTKSVPVISALGRLLPVINLTSSHIQSGTMLGQFAQGQLHVSSILLRSDGFDLLANGKASLRSGNLDFSGALNTGGGIDAQVTQAVTQKLIASAFPELLILTGINDFVRNRTVYFDVTGNSKHPKVKPQAAPTIIRALLQNAARKFANLPLTATGTVLQNGN